MGLLTDLRLDQKQVFYSIIADGNHTHETVLRIAYKSNPAGTDVCYIELEFYAKFSHLIVLTQFVFLKNRTCTTGDYTFCVGIYTKRGHLQSRTRTHPFGQKGTRFREKISPG